MCSAWRWRLVARSLGMNLSLPGAVADCYQALFLNSVLPAGVLGDVHRAVDQGRRSGDVGRGVRAVVLERLAGQLVLMAVAVVVLAARPTLIRVAGDLLPGGGWWLAATVLASLGGAAWVWRAPLAALTADLRAVLRADTWPGVVGLSVLALAGYLAMFVFAARAAGSAAPVAELLPLLVLALLAMSVPVNVGGWGPREAAAAVGFGAVGLGAGQGLGTAVVYGVLGLVSCLPGGVVLLLRRVTRSARTTTPGWPADRAPSGPTPATAARPLPIPSMRPALDSTDVDARPRVRRLARSAA